MLDMLAEKSGHSDPFSGELAVALLMRSETGLIALDDDRRVVLINPAARQLLGLVDPVEGQTLAASLQRRSSLGADAVAAAAQWLEGQLMDTLFLPLDAESKLSVVPSSGPGGHRLLALKRTNRAAAPVNRRDPLTGLADRAWFMERLTAAMAAPGGSPALLVLDLDRFKAVNDSLGQSVGDALLQLVAKRLTSAVRDADVICRLSGDEFAIVMNRPSDPEAVGRRLVALLSRAYLIEDTTVPVGVSVGVALAPEHGKDAGALIRAAEIALYAAKNGGRGDARVFDAELDATSRRRATIVDALRRAIPLNQLRLIFQPQIVLETGGLAGFEAFLRWEHPQLGTMRPSAFLTIAEESGMVWTIGEWVLRQACEQAITWPMHLCVSVNVSARQLTDQHRLPRMIKTVLLQTGLAPNRLEIEVPESALTQQPEALPILKAIHAMGVRVSLDDFGTGTSSLSDLRQFPLHRLKIDHSFVQALGQSEEATNVVRAIAALGRTLGIATIAEGVETLDQQHRVEQDGCKAIQGNVLSRPVPANEVAEIIARLLASVDGNMPVA